MDLATIFLAVTSTFNLPAGLLSSICWVESNHRPSAIHLDDGGSPSQGVCQLKLTTARLMGFKGPSRQLMRPRVNVYYAGKYLRYQLDRYEDASKAILAYNAGSYRLNRKGRPVNRHYLNKVNKIWHRAEK